MLVLGKYGPKPPFCIKIGLLQSLGNELSSKRLGAEEKSEIVAISNRCKDTLDDLINSLDLESPDRPGPIDERSRNAPRSVGSSTGLLKGGCLDKNVSDCRSV